MHIYKEEITNYLNDKVNLEEVLIRLPNTNERLFETCIIEIISKSSKVESDAKEILSRMGTSNETKYKAFYLLCSLFRRRKDITIYGSLLYEYKEQFDRNDTFGYLKAMYLIQTGLTENIRQAVILASKSLDRVKDNIGIQHCYCEMVAEAFEENIFHITNEKDKMELNRASETIKDIIVNDIEDYAKFYCTYGRILALSKDYKEAKIQIKKSIDKEKSNRHDYSLRISEYLKHLMAITSAEKMDEIEQKMSSYGSDMEQFDNKIEGTLSKNIEFLGFFAALVSFVIASVQILGAQSVEDALKLIVVLGGVQMLVIGSFSLILSGKNGIKRSIIVFVMALITIIFGIKIV